MTTLAELLASSRVLALRRAVAAKLAERFADVEVAAHIGKLDVSDVLAGDLFPATSIRVAATRVVGEERLSGADDACVHLTAYVYAESRMVGGAMVKADEIAIAIGEGLVIALADNDFADWGVANIGAVEQATMAPLFTALTHKTGAAVYYAVTWRQALIALPPANFWTGGDGA